MAEDSAAGLVQHEAAQPPVARDEPRLLPERFAGRRRNSSDDDVPDLSLGMGADDVDDLAGVHLAVRFSL